MVRFIDLGHQMGLDEEYPRQFCFFNTSNDHIIEVDGEQLFGSWEEFEEAFIGIKINVSLPRTIEQFKSLCPPWVFETKKD